jgi:hypothetical protein
VILFMADDTSITEEDFVPIPQAIGRRDRRDRDRRAAAAEKAGAAESRRTKRRLIRDARKMEGLRSPAHTGDRAPRVPTVRAYPLALRVGLHTIPDGADVLRIVGLDPGLQTCLELANDPEPLGRLIALLEDIRSGRTVENQIVFWYPNELGQYDLSHDPPPTQS